MSTHALPAARLDAPATLPCADALALLAERHAQVSALAEECRRFARHVSTERDLQRVAESLCGTVHALAEIEEQSLYPAARAALATASVTVDLAALELATARTIIRQLQRVEAGSPCYQALVVALADCVERHARHERDELFPRVRATCLDLAPLGARLGATTPALAVAA